ncbi:MAG: DUF6491 family protein [Rhizomicrobium sp.]
MRTATALLMLVVLSGPALADTAAPPCLRQNMVFGWKVVNDRTLIVTDRVRNRFKVSLAPGCFDLKFHLALSFRSLARIGLACLGRNDFVLVRPGGGDPAQRCLIAEIQPYRFAAIPPK